MGVLLYNPNICIQKVRKGLEKSVFAQFENKDIFYTMHQQPTARVPSMAPGKVFNGTLSELKYSNYDLIKKLNF
jgi:hypothetical protein